MKQLYIILSVLFCSLNSYSQTWQWARRAGSTQNDYLAKIDVDETGNSYIAGKFNDTISFGAVTLLSPGISSIYLAKYDISGNFQWAKIAASDSAINIGGIHIDKHGNISLVGQYADTGYFGDTHSDTLISSGDYDVFVARYDADGNLLWASSTGGTGYDYGSGVSNDFNGNTFITGEFHVTPFQFSSSKIFIAKYDSLGNNSWFKIPQTYSSTDIAEGIVTDSTGTSYITGQFFSTLSFDASVVLDAGNVEANVYVGKFNSDGTNTWLQKAGAASGYCGGIGIAIDKRGNNYLTGFFHGTISFGTLNLSSSFGITNEIFIAKCDSGGNFNWVVKPYGPGQVRAIAVNENNECYVSGYFTTSLQVGSTTLVNNAPQAIFILKADSSGNFDFATQVGGIYNISLGGIKTEGSDIFFISGIFSDTLNFNSSLSLETTGSNFDLFTAKMSDVTGIQEVMLNKFITIYPNPVTDISTTSFFVNKKDNIDLSLYDITGNKVQTIVRREFLSGAQTIPFKKNNLTPGLYLLRLSSSFEQFVLKVIIE